MHTVASRDETMSRTAILCVIINLLYVGAASVAVKELGVLCVCVCVTDF